MSMELDKIYYYKHRNFKLQVFNFLENLLEILLE